MPKYEFECQTCNLLFSRNLAMGEYSVYECPKCNCDAPRVWDGFAVKFDSGDKPQGTTGVHSEDYPTADKAVGKSAEKRWVEIGERDKVKNEARKKGGTHALIRHSGKNYIDYEPMTETGRAARRKLAKHTVEKLSQAEPASK